jgi:hypothetical protein
LTAGFKCWQRCSKSPGWFLLRWVPDMIPGRRLFAICWGGCFCRLLFWTIFRVHRGVWSWSRLFCRASILLMLPLEARSRRWRVEGIIVIFWRRSSHHFWSIFFHSNIGETIMRIRRLRKRVILWACRWDLRRRNRLLES